MQTPVLRYYSRARDHIVNYASFRGDCIAFAPSLNSPQNKGALVMDCPYMFIAVLYSARDHTAYFFTETELRFMYVGKLKHALSYARVHTGQ